MLREVLWRSFRSILLVMMDENCKHVQCRSKSSIVSFRQQFTCWLKEYISELREVKFKPWKQFRILVRCWDDKSYENQMYVKVVPHFSRRIQLFLEKNTFCVNLLFHAVILLKIYFFYQQWHFWWKTTFSKEIVMGVKNQIN